MAFTRYASFESAEVLDVRSAPTRQHQASLDKFADFNKYRTDDGYVYVRIRAISSRVNKNHDGWPSVELAGSPEIFKRHQSGVGFTVEAKDGNPKYGFATFLHKPIFVDHHNTDPTKGRGVIRDAKLRVLDQHTAASDDYWKSTNVDPEHLPATEIELLLEVDAKKYPKFAAAIINGDLDGFSMGANVGKTKCSHCGNIATEPGEFCSHILMKGAHHDFKTADGKKISRKSYENCYDVQFFEISGVFDPADETALAREVRSAVHKEGYMANDPDDLPDPMRPRSVEEQIYQDAKKLHEEYDIDPRQALDIATKKYEPARGGDEGFSVEGYPKQWQYDSYPEDLQAVHFSPEQGAYPNNPALSKTAEHQLPQEFLTRAPEEVDTLRKEQVCPVCGSEMDGTTCDVCGYTKPPKSFDNPDLNKATEIREQMKQNEENPAPAPEGPPGGPPSSGPPTKNPSISAVTNDMHWTPVLHPKTAALINQNEQPVSSSNRPLSNDTKKETVVSDQTKPVTSAMLTAKQLIEQTRKSGESMNTRTADGATPLPEASPKTRVDVTGVGGVDQASNEEASKADAQVDVTGIGGTGVSDVSADESESLPTAGEKSDDSGFNKDKTTDDSGPTKTYGDKDGTEEGARDPVTSEPFPRSEDGVKKSNERVAYDDNTLEQNEQQGDPIAQGGSAVQGVKPVAEQFGERVNLLEHKTSPENNSGPTKTWTGTDGNGVLKQQEPVTKDQVDYPGSEVRSHLIAAIRLAETEEELGLISRDEKWSRVAALERESDESINAQLTALARVKTAGMARLAEYRQSSVTKVPRLFGQNTVAPNGFERIASEKKEEPTFVTDDTLDSALFVR